MFNAADSLLPITATDLAKALDILEERLFDLPVAMISKDPWTVEAGLLDDLAWEMSVDVWDLDWPEDVKRNVIAISAEVHRFKGTPFAIKTALSAFDVDSDLLEWWEPEGVDAGFEPGSFRVTAYAGRSLYNDSENSINTGMLTAMNAVVERVAPVSRKLIFRLGERFETETQTGSGMRQRRIQRAECTFAPRPNVVAHSVRLASGSLVTRRFEQVFDPTPRPTTATAVTRMASASCARAVSQEFHDFQRRATG